MRSARMVVMFFVIVGCRSQQAPVVPASVLEEPARPPRTESELLGDKATPVEPQRDDAKIERGRYVAAVSGCITCHTPLLPAGPDASKIYAGGLEAPGPDGKGLWRAPNITPDPETGIGAWTDDQIIAAIREGVRPDGSRLLPIMPYPHFHAMTDADAAAVVAFLRDQKPIKNKVERSTGVAMQPVTLATPIGNVDPTTDRPGHGAYLVALAHCGACHTPRSGPAANKLMAGGMAMPTHDGSTVIASNLTGDPGTGLGAWSETDIAHAIRTMTRPDGRPIRGPMAMYEDAWSALTDDDLSAIAAYIKSLPPVKNPDEPASPRK